MLIFGSLSSELGVDGRIWNTARECDPTQGADLEMNGASQALLG